MMIGSVVEFVASFAMEKGLGTISWDYSDKLLNLHGRICLQYSFCWGLLALLVLYVLDRFLYGFVSLFGRQVGEMVLTVLMVLVLLSVVVTLAGLARIRKRVAVLKAQAPGEAVTASVTAWDRLNDRLVPDPVMINTFRRMSLPGFGCRDTLRCPQSRTAGLTKPDVPHGPEDPLSAPRSRAQRAFTAPSSQSSARAAADGNCAPTAGNGDCSQAGDYAHDLGCSLRTRQGARPIAG